MIREALAGELSEWPTAENGEAKFVLDEDGVKGHACVSRIETPFGEQCWLHDVRSEGSANGFAELALRVRRQVHDWGFTEVWTNVLIDSPMFEFWLKQGFEVQQYVMKGSI